LERRDQPPGEGSLGTLQQRENLNINFSSFFDNTVFAALASF